MLAGEKPLAFFSEPTRSTYELPDAEFEPYVQAGRIIKWDFVGTVKIARVDEEIRFLYFALPDEEWRIDAAHRIKWKQTKTKTETEEDAFFIGKLLGYSDHEIACYVNRSSFVVKRSQGQGG